MWLARVSASLGGQPCWVGAPETLIWMSTLSGWVWDQRSLSLVASCGVLTVNPRVGVVGQCGEGVVDFVGLQRPNQVCRESQGTEVGGFIAEFLDPVFAYG